MSINQQHNYQSNFQLNDVQPNDRNSQRANFAFNNFERDSEEIEENEKRVQELFIGNNSNHNQITPQNYEDKDAGDCNDNEDIQMNEIDTSPVRKNIITSKKSKKKDYKPFPHNELDSDVFLNEQGEEKQKMENNEEDFTETSQLSIDFNQKQEEIEKQKDEKEQKLEDILDNYDDDKNNQILLLPREDLKLDYIFDDIEQIFNRTDEYVQDEFALDDEDKFLSQKESSTPQLQQQSTFSIQDYLKTTINDHFFNGDTPFVKEKLDETIRKVYHYVDSQIESKQQQIRDFEKKLKRFIFDYRYDQNHKPRRYISKDVHEQNLKQKFQDPKYDNRKISFELQDIDNNPFSLYSNEVDVYVNTLSNHVNIL